MPADITISLRKLAGAFLDLGSSPGVNINKGAVQLQTQVEAVPERVRQAVVLLKQSCDLRDKQFMRKVMDLLDAGPADGREMLTSVLADINHEEKQGLKKVDYHAQGIAAVGSLESEAFWKGHFGLQSTVPWRIFQDIFVQAEYGDLDHAGFAQLTFLLRKYLDPQGTGTVAHHRFVQFLDTKWAAVKTEFVPQRGLKLPTARRDAEALPLLVTAVQKPTLYLREGMSFALTQQGYSLSMRLHKDGITVFGRKSERAKSIVDVQLDDPSVSQIHAQVVFRERKFWLVDLGSTGGTYILMRKSTPVHPGFVFQLGFGDVFVVTEVNGEQLFSLDGDREEVVDAGTWFARGGVEEVKVQMAPHADLESEEGERRAVPPPLDEEGEISAVMREESGSESEESGSQSEESEEEKLTNRAPAKSPESEASDSASSGEYQEEGEEEDSEEVESSEQSQDSEENGGGDEGGNSSDEDQNPAIPEESQEDSSEESQEDSESQSEHSQSLQQSEEQEDSQESESSQSASQKSVGRKSASKAASVASSVHSASKDSSSSAQASSLAKSSSRVSASQESSSEVSSSQSYSQGKSSKSASQQSGSERSKASIHPQVHPNIELLCVLKGEHLGRRWRFPADPEGVTIGKSHDCHIRLHSDQIRSKHCRFVVENGAWVVEDYAVGDRVWLMLSDYSTMRRKEPSGAYLLEPGSRFKLGGVDFEVGG